MPDQCMSSGCFISATILFLIANILNIAAIFVCDFVSPVDYNGPNTPNDDAISVRGFGMYRIQDQQGMCRLISPTGNLFDPDTGDWLGGSVGDTVTYWAGVWINVARFGGTLAAVMGLFTWIGMWCAFGCCCGCWKNRCCRMGYAAVALCCCLFTSGMFLVFESPYCQSGCALGTGGILAIVSALLYFITGILCCCIQTPKSVEEEKPKEAIPSKGAKIAEDPEDPSVPPQVVPVVPPPSDEPENKPENKPETEPAEVLIEEKTLEEEENNTDENETQVTGETTEEDTISPYAGCSDMLSKLCH
mmetsp:Transcript_20197/g.30372  ORF Transcript_20197/g.30372 Transcript_20197/m.30372 type:complete len:304 (+) Transcript_20197:25-936(+)